MVVVDVVDVVEVEAVVDVEDVEVVVDVVEVAAVVVMAEASIQILWTVTGTVLLQHLLRFQCCRGMCRPLVRESSTRIP